MDSHAIDLGADVDASRSIKVNDTKAMGMVKVNDTKATTFYSEMSSLMPVFISIHDDALRPT